MERYILILTITHNATICENFMLIGKIQKKLSFLKFKIVCFWQIM